MVPLSKGVHVVRLGLKDDETADVALDTLDTLAATTPSNVVLDLVLDEGTGYVF